MKKKSRHLKPHRNAGPPPAGPKRRRRLRVPRVRMPRRGTPPDWKTTVAAIAGGAGGAALGGLIVNQQILSPEAVGIGMISLGGATAYFADGNARVLGNSVAAAGAGQLALALMGRRAIAADRLPEAAAPSVPLAPAPPQLGPGPAPPPAVGPPRRSATDGGTVVELFRDAALELDRLEEDEWRYGMRGGARADRDDVFELELDLDEAA